MEKYPETGREYRVSSDKRLGEWVQSRPARSGPSLLIDVMMSVTANRELIGLCRRRSVQTAYGWRLTRLMQLVMCLLGLGQASLAEADEPWQLKQAARESFQQEDTEAARSHLQALLEHYRGISANANGTRSRYIWSQQLAEVAHEYLRASQLRDALNVLGEAADMQLPPHNDLDDGLASAAAGLHRRLTALNADERFELLHDWSMPTESRRSVRVLTSITPTDAPPTVFARALGERIRRDSFTVPEIGEIRGLFSTAWELVKAADEAGRLRRLTGEVGDLVERGAPNADLVLTLIKIVAAKREDSELRDGLLEQAANLKDAAEKPQSNAELVIAAACLTREWLHSIGEAILKAKLEQTYDRESLLIRPFLRYALATANRQRQQEAGSDLLASSDLELWVPSTVQDALRHAQGSVRPIWVSHEDHILHLTGPGNDFLFFKYPLIGEFEFACETQNGGRASTEGGVGYGGLGYEVWGARSTVRIWDANMNTLALSHCPFVPDNPLATFNHFALKRAADRVTFAANRHATWTDAGKNVTFPWIGLRSFGDHMPIFRSLKISGNPVIPREVTMVEDDVLRGWVARYYQERTPQPGPLEFALNPLLKQRTTNFEWSADGGVLYGARREAAADISPQSRLYYFRPLQNGESINYEFQYEPGQIEVHPALGRLAFLIEPDGVRLHWMTDGDREWTGLAEDNTAVEPLNRRGPRPVPLVAGQWNRVAFALKNDTVTLSLNETTIYSRKLEPENERTFGFYHDKNRSEVRVQNVVMRGDWPENLTRHQLDNLAASSNPNRSTADRRVLGAVFDDQHLHGSVLAVRRRALELPAEDRYDFLAGWVLPSPDHSTLRLALDFTPTHPSPPVSGENVRLPAGETRVSTGGDLVAPALDLVKSARDLGRLDELRSQVDKIPVTGDQQRRSRLSMLALIDISSGDLNRARDAIDELASLVASGTQLEFSERWPETLAIWEASSHTETRDAVRDMAFHIVEKQIRKRLPSGYEPWERHALALASRLRYFDLLDRDPALRQAAKNRFGGESPLANWISASRQTTRSRGQGLPRSRWELLSRGSVENFASHDDDYLFYRIPLRGNFEVECDLTALGWRETNLWVAGRWFGPIYTLNAFSVGDFRKSTRVALDPPLHRPDATIHHRTVVRDGICTTYFNGRKLDERLLAADHDPWIAIRSPPHTDGVAHNVRINGKPEIPKEIRMTATADLSCWLPVTYGHRVGPGCEWEQLGDLASGGGILGARWNDLPNSNRENLLRYHRPMAEDGTIEYQFFYRPGEMHVHPALDRLAFMLQPGGVRIHWVTDGKYDRTELAPGNQFDEPDNRRGGEALPLKPNAWNRLQLSLTGDIVDLTLNDELIYQRMLEPTNQRTFGLFHYADRTEVRVRNVVWRGEWPRVLPSVAEQELADENTDFLDESLHELADTFHHEFSKHGLPPKRFALLVGEPNDFEVQPSGLKVTRPGGNGYVNSAIAPHLSIEGDFDIIAAFEQFEPKPTAGGSSGLYLQVVLDNDKSNEFLLSLRHLRHRSDPQPVVRAWYVTREAGGDRRNRFLHQVVEATSGRLRVARRGDTVYYLFAEGDSPNFRLFEMHTAAKDNVAFDGVRLMTQTQGEGLTKAVWKSISIRAQKLEGLAFSDPETVLAKLNQQRDSLPDRFQHDFANTPLTDDRFHRWGTVTTQKPEEDGLRVIAPGSDAWTSVGLAPQFGLEGDFDVAVNLDVIGFGEPKAGMKSSLYLFLRFSDERQTEASIIFLQSGEGKRRVNLQIKDLDANGNAVYRSTSTLISVNAIEKLRIARRGKRVSFIFRKKGSERDEILTQANITDLPIPKTFVRLMLHKGGAGSQSEVLLKQLRVRAQKIDPIPSD
jgi:hypothetical protein